MRRPATNCHKTKRPPSCRKFCVDFKNKSLPKSTEWNLSNFTVYTRALRKTIEKLLKIAIYIFFTIMKNISLFTTNMVYIYFHTQYKIMWMAGWVITKLFEGLQKETCTFKYFSFHLTSRQCFPHNFVDIQQIWLVDGLNCFYRTHATTSGWIQILCVYRLVIRSSTLLDIISWRRNDWLTC